MKQDTNAMENTHFIRSYFQRLAFEPELTDIYLALARQSPQTISELARTSGVERTRIYRLTESLLSSGLIEVENQYHRTLYKAAPISNVQILLAKKEQDLQDLQSDFSHLQQMFTLQKEQGKTRVQFYYGAEGAKQFFWNQTKAKGEVLCILRENMQIKTKAAFFERWVRRCNERGIIFRGLVGEDFQKSQEEWYSKHENERLENWEQRFVPHDLFPIAHSTIIYDNMTAYYNWQATEVFALEIFNPDIANGQRALFELLWKQAQSG